MTAPRDVWVYCERCEAIIPMPEDRVLRATQDHELDEHRGGYGETLYHYLGVATRERCA